MHELRPPPIRPYFESLRCALCGFRDAFTTERNLKLFTAAVSLSFILAAFLNVSLPAWIALIVVGGMFLGMELLNTALEHFSDAFDTHSKRQQDVHFHAIKATKDIAAAAALVTAVTWGVVNLLILAPAVLSLLNS